MHNEEKYWEEEFKKFGTRNAIISRILFHNGLKVSHVVDLSGRSWSTIRKHFKRLEAEGLIIKSDTSLMEEYFKPSDLMRKLYDSVGRPRNRKN